MNLTGDPWVPVVFISGESGLVSLADAFRRGDEVLDLVATPPQRIALTRLLVCIAQAALDGPTDEWDWRSCRDRIAPAALAYLHRWSGSFGLFGPDAFLQVPNLETTNNAALDKLDLGLAAGNNAVLFDHGATDEGRLHPAAWSALMVLTYQCFSPGGTIGVSQWAGSSTSRTSEHAPCLEGSMIHTIIRGPSLATTIHLNLLTRELVERSAQGRWGRPVWETMPHAPDEASVDSLSKSYLGRLVPVPRAIKLQSEASKATLANGLSYPKLPHREPAGTVVRRGADERLAYLAVDLAKHPWRDLGSILASSPSADEGGPWVLRHLVPGDGEVDLWTGGLAAHKGKLLDAAEWSFHLPLALVGEIVLEKYHRGVELADAASRRLLAAIAGYSEDLALSEFTRNDRQSRMRRQRIVAKATALYWRALDGRYGSLVETATDPTADLGGTWYRLVREAMETAYQRSCPHSSPRQIRAFAKGKQRLRLKKPGQRNANEAA